MSDALDLLARPALRLRGRLATAGKGAAALAGIAAEWEVAPLTARILLGRGVGSRDAAQRMLSPRLRDLRDPGEMAGFAPALELLEDVVRRRRRVGIFGDYDVDGITTTAILSTFLGSLGVEVIAQVATRQGGYGFHVEAARTLAEAGAEVVLTGDCGTSDIEALEWLQRRGTPVVVIDHHQIPDPRPPAHALINPHQSECGFPFKGLCSAGVAFYLCAALRTRLRERGGAGELPDPRAWLDLVALGTVCDMVPLVDENRILVRHGLDELERRSRPGVRALLRRAGIADDVRLDAEHLGFQLGPRLNAPGRLSSAEPAFNLLRARSDAEAEPFAAEVERFNRQRKAHQEQIVSEAFGQLDADPRVSKRAGLVVIGDGWAPGVVGVAASNLVERYGRTALVLARDPTSGELRGSARSHGGVDVHAALRACAHLLTRFGGHPAAAGVSLTPERAEALVEAFDAAVAVELARVGTPGEDSQAYEHDGELKLEEVDLALVAALREIGPYGQSFAAPRFVAQEVRVDGVRVVGGRHLQLRLRQGSTRRSAIAFGQGELPVAEGESISLSFSPARNDFGGRISVQLVVDRIWR